jgi:serine/threonine-protein kinase RsbW
VSRYAALPPLSVPARLESLSKVGEYVMKAAEAANLDKKAAYHLRLALDEMATNAIVHGYEEANLEGNLYLGGKIYEDTLAMYLEDTAPPYDPRQRPPPNSLDEPLEEREIGGLGIFLAFKGVDQYRYENFNGRNRSTFTMKRV